jgi:hypothetical protein
MKKPARYYVPCEDEALWEKELARVKKLNPGVEEPEDLTEPTNYWVNRDFDELEAARQFAKEVGNDVYERVGIEEDPLAPGMWDYEERLVRERV